jgi:hypothetical protein
MSEPYSVWLKKQLLNAFFNPYDLRFWIRQIIWFIVQVVLLSLLLIESIGTQVPFVYIIMALAMTVAQIPANVWLFIGAMKKGREVQNAFTKHDLNQDDFLSQDETLVFISSFPPKTFRTLEKSKEFVSLQDLQMAMQTPRSETYLAFFEFATSWISFMATLMLYNGTLDGLVIFQGVLSVLDSFHLYQRFVAQYLSKYTSGIICVRFSLKIMYWSTMFGVLLFLLLGYIVSVEIAHSIFAINNGTSATALYANTQLRVIELPGFVTGYTLLVILIIVFALFACCYGFLACCNCVGIRSRHENGLPMSVDDIFQS